MNFLIKLIVGISVVLFIPYLGEGQDSKKPTEWKEFTDVRNGFSVDLPREPQRALKHIAFEKDETKYFRCSKALDVAYKLEIQPFPVRTVVEIGVFDVSGCKRKSTDFDKETKRLVRNYSADDDNDHIIRNEFLTKDGNRARLFVVRTSADNYDWHLFVETDKRVYWIGIGTMEEKGSDSPNAIRIIDSFRLIKY